MFSTMYCKVLKSNIYLQRIENIIIKSDFNIPH